jgi:hypothetical protein
MTEPGQCSEARDRGFLDRVVNAWRKAEVIHQSPSWNGQPEARALAEEAALHPEHEAQFFELLGDPNSRVAAYALLALDLMRSERLTDLPEALLANRSKLTFHFGSFRSTNDLGGFARQIQKLASARESSSPTRP